MAGAWGMTLGGEALAGIGVESCAEHLSAANTIEIISADRARQAGAPQSFGSFVDARRDLRYNTIMEDMVYDVLATEVAAPKRKYIRSEGGLYALLVVGALAAIGLGNRLRVWLDLSPVLVQGTLYALLFLMGYWVLRYRLTGHRYTLTDKAFFVTRLTGKSEKLMAEVPLAAIEYAGPYNGAKLKELGCRMGPNVRVGRIEDTTMLIYREDGALAALCLSAGEKLKGMLTEPWKK